MLEHVMLDLGNSCGLQIGYIQLHSKLNRTDPNSTHISDCNNTQSTPKHLKVIKSTNQIESKIDPTQTSTLTPFLYILYLIKDKSARIIFCASLKLRNECIPK